MNDGGEVGDDGQFKETRGAGRMTETLVLPEKLDTLAAPGFVDGLRKRQGADLVLDGRHLGHLGALCFQAIAVAAQDWRDAGYTLTLANLTDETQAQLLLYGVTPDCLVEGSIG